MDKITFIGSVSLNKNIFEGETLKNKILLEYLNGELRNNNLVVIDTFQWKKNPINIISKIIFTILNPFRKKIILSAYSSGSYMFLKLFYFFRFMNKDIYNFILGGSLPEFLLKEKWNIKYYNTVKKNYVEIEGLKRILLGFGLKNISHIPNWKKYKFSPKNNHKNYKNISRLRVFSFSKISIGKGTDMIFEAINNLNSEKHIFEMDFYGIIDPEYKEIFYEQMNQKEYFKHKGTIDLFNEDNYNILADYDLMLFPTFYKGEGFPGTLLDCYIAGVPVVASNWHYNADLVKDKKTGFLFEAKNIDEFTNILHDIFENRTMLNTLRDNCVEEAKKFKIEALMAEFAEEIDS